MQQLRDTRDTVLLKMLPTLELHQVCHILPLGHCKPSLRLSCRYVTGVIEPECGQETHKPQGQANGSLGLKATSRFNKSAVHNLEGCLCWLMAHLLTAFALTLLCNKV